MFLNLYFTFLQHEWKYSVFIAIFFILSESNSIDERQFKMIQLMKKRNAEDLERMQKVEECLSHQEGFTGLDEIFNGYESSLNDIPKKYLYKCLDQKMFSSDKTTLSSIKTNGQLGNQMSTFATLYGISKIFNDSLRVGVHLKQFQTLSVAFPFFELNFNKYLIDSWYCGMKHTDMDWVDIDIDSTLAARDIQIQLRFIPKTFPFGKAFSLPPYINLPQIYAKFHDKLLQIFKLKPSIIKESDEAIDAIIQNNMLETPTSVIGIHVRSNKEYVNHLKNFGLKPIGPAYYEKAILHFRKKYANPLFIIVSDSETVAKKNVLHYNEQKGNGKNLYFIGKTKSDRDDSFLVDFGILIRCDHLVLSHGTFGMWAALLSTNNNYHIMPLGLKNGKGQNVKLPEMESLESSIYQNFIFMSDD